MLEKTLESPMDCKEIQPVHSKGDQSWVFFGRNDAKAETLVLWPPHVKSWLIGKDSDAGRDWGQEEKGRTVGEMAGWHHRLDGHESEWTPGVGDAQGGLVCCDSWGPKSWTRLSDWTELQFLTWSLQSLCWAHLSPSSSMTKFLVSALLCTVQDFSSPFPSSILLLLGSLFVVWNRAPEKWNFGVLLLLPMQFEIKIVSFMSFYGL